MFFIDFSILLVNGKVEDPKRKLDLRITERILLLIKFKVCSEFGSLVRPGSIKDHIPAEQVVRTDQINLNSINTFFS
jgi:hypothetical protein